MSTLSAIYGTVHALLSNFFVTPPIPEAHGDMSKLVYVVTGANTGLGLELSRHLLRLGVGKLIMGVRSPSKGEAAKKDLLTSTKRKDSAVDVWTIDMDDYSSIKAFAKRVQTLPRVDGICANAGMMTTTFSLSEGIEKTLNVNVVSTFLLFFLLLPKMREHEQAIGTRSHFTIVNSGLHYTAKHKELYPTHDILDRLSDPKKANMANRYPLSKLLVLWNVRELAAQGTSMPILNSPNPSFCQSGLLREDDSAFARIAEKYLARTTESGSRTLYHAQFAGPESHGQYLANCHVQK
jgi:NAD(P)-dependent dehydrogenase (short-subunit alcohol dehydrogenase family)